MKRHIPGFHNSVSVSFFPFFLIFPTSKCWKYPQRFQFSHFFQLFTIKTESIADVIQFHGFKWALQPNNLQMHAFNGKHPIAFLFDISTWKSNRHMGHVGGPVGYVSDFSSGYELQALESAHIGPPWGGGLLHPLSSLPLPHMLSEK